MNDRGRDPAPGPEERIPKEVLDLPVCGLRLTGVTLGDALGAGPTLLVFLRHLG